MIFQQNQLTDLKQLLSCYENSRVVLTNGCFDLFHAGHSKLLNDIREFEQYDAAYSNKKHIVLIVAVNTDESIRKIKGSSRPIINEMDRAEIVSNHKAVKAVVLFDDLVPIINEIKPYSYWKGGDYTIKSLDPEERKALQRNGAYIRFCPIKKDISTSKIIDLVMTNYLNFNC